MVTTLTVQSDPQQAWRQTALAALEHALGQSLTLWILHPANGWLPRECARGVGRPENADAIVTPRIEAVLPVIENATDNGTPVTREIAPGHYLLVIPLDDRSVDTASLQTDCPEILVGLANVATSYFHQQEEVTRLREENDFFLKQVSDDFEELTFLRSMAERLGLGDSTHSVEQLVAASLPELGKSVHAEELYFVSKSEEAQEILAFWHANKKVFVPLSEETVLKLVQAFRESSAEHAIIKNGLDDTAESSILPGVRDFIMVPVLNAAVPLGWFLAINRRPEAGEVSCPLPEWRLSQHEFGTSEASLLSTAAAMIASHANNLSLFQEREVLLVNVVRTLVSAVEAKDEYTCGHSERVALYGKSLARQVGYDEEACELLYLTGLLHDVGKIAINDAILNKPDRLTDEEFAEIQRHPEEGWKILHGLKQLNYVLPGVLHHHERQDGNGYPDGLAGREIPLDGRVLAVADAYDAMTSNRAYRTGMPHEKAVAILREGAGTQWDAEIIDAFLEILPEITTIRETYQPRQHPCRIATSTVSQTE